MTKLRPSILGAAAMAAAIVLGANIEAAVPSPGGGWYSPGPGRLIATNATYGGYFFIDNPNNAAGFMQTNGNGFACSNGVLYVFSATNTSWFASGVFTGTLSVSNLATAVLTPTSAQTNYTALLGGQGTAYLLYPANTNVFLTLNGTNVLGNTASIQFDNRTSTIPCTVTFNLPAHCMTTNMFMGAFPAASSSAFVVTNGQCVVLNLWNLNAAGTNIQANLSAPCVGN